MTTRHWAPKQRDDRFWVTDNYIEGILVDVTYNAVVLDNDGTTIMVDTKPNRVRNAFALARPLLSAHVKVSATGIAINTQDLDNMGENPMLGGRIESGCMVETSMSYSAKKKLTYPMWKARIKSALHKRAVKEGASG